MSLLESDTIRKGLIDLNNAIKLDINNNNSRK